jgi:uncharacterized membrane protein
MDSVVSEDPLIVVTSYAILIYTMVAASCSSPQTAEINADKRAATLMKWVTIGFLQSIPFIVIGVLLDKRRWPPLAGSGLAAGMLWWQYQYALKSGLASAEPGTEG